MESRIIYHCEKCKVDIPIEIAEISVVWTSKSRWDAATTPRHKTCLDALETLFLTPKNQ